jgi:hypothetical protein
VVASHANSAAKRDFRENFYFAIVLRYDIWDIVFLVGEFLEIVNIRLDFVTLIVEVFLVFHMVIMCPVSRWVQLFKLRTCDFTDLIPNYAKQNIIYFSICRNTCHFFFLIDFLSRNSLIQYFQCINNWLEVLLAFLSARWC